MLVLALQFSTSGRGRAPSKIDGAQASGDGDLELSSSSGAALPRGRGRSGLTAGGRVLPQNGTVMPDAAAPVVPHPRLHERAFVLVPLAELAPGWRHPVLGGTVELIPGQ